MLNPDNAHTTLLQAVASDSQSTHNIAAQATAGRLIPLLEKRYSYPHEAVREEQDTLLSFMRQTIEAIKTKSDLPKVEIIRLGEPHPVGQLISILLTLEHSDDEKIAMLTELKILAANYPGDVWSNDDAQWSLNRIYNAQSGVIEQVLSSPAKTLTLVCAAILDKNHHLREESNTTIPTSSSYVYSPEPSDEEARLKQLATGLAGILKELAEEAASGESSKCAAGRQHDLLWLLQPSYLDENNKLFEFIDNLSVYLTQLLSRFIQEKLLSQIEPEDRFRLITCWIIHDKNTRNEENLLLDYIKRLFGENWLEICIEWMSEHSAQVGICPKTNAKIIKEMATILLDMSLPLSEDNFALRIAELYNAPTPQYCTRFTQALLEARNAALQRFKLCISKLDWSDLTTEAVSDLYTAESYFQRVLRYSGMLLIGNEGSAIEEANQTMTPALLDFFCLYKPNALLNDRFYSIKAAYDQQEKLFNAQSQQDVIENFLLLMKTNPEHYESYWMRLQTIPDLKLSDERIQRLIRAHQEVNITIQEGLPNHPESYTLTTITSLSTYDINRLLIHGMNVAPNLWSTLYRQTLLSVCLWLLIPISQKDSISLKAIKRGYPKYLLTNLLLHTLLTPAMQKSISDYLAQVYSIETGKKFLHIDLLIYYCCYRPLPEVNQLFDLIKPYFGLLIKNSKQARTLLTYCPEELNPELWMAIKINLSRIIKNVDQLKSLLKLPIKSLNQAQRSQLFATIAKNLPQIIKKGKQLYKLLNLSPEQLKQELRTQLLNAVEKNLPRIIQSSVLLHKLLRLSPEQFNQEQRGLLWKAIKRELPRIIKSSIQLHNLLKLSPEQLNQEQRIQLWKAVENDLAKIIKNGYQLRELLQLSPEQLGQEHRIHLWGAVENNLATLIENEAQLLGLLQLSLKQLNQNQRLQLWESVKNDLTKTIKNPILIKQLLELSPEAELITTLVNNFDQIILDDTELISFFHLPSKDLDVQQRTQLLTAFINSKTLIIEYVFQLVRFLNLSLEQFTIEHRKQLWTAIEDRLEIILLYAPSRDLERLLSLDYMQLDQEQRKKIYTVLKKNNDWSDSWLTTIFPKHTVETSMKGSIGTCSELGIFSSSQASSSTQIEELTPLP